MIDSRSRSLESEQLAALETLARQVVAQMELLRVASELASALEGLRTLQTMLPICAWCKGIRNDSGYWSRLEDYLSQEAGSTLTHGICPTCFERETLKLVI